MKPFFTTFILTVLFLASTFTASLAQSGFEQVWQKNEGNPVFNVLEGPGSSWNTVAVQLAMNIGHAMWDGSEYKFYMGGNDGDNFSIGMATSTSLDSGWTWYPENPVLTPGSSGVWDDHDVGSPMVIKDGDVYKMWYLGSPNANVNWKIGYATSSDGITWEKYPDPVLEFVPGTWEISLSSMYVIKDGDSLKMWYAADGLGTNGIGYAVSQDGINWVKSSENPVLQPGKSGQFDAGFVTVPSVRLEDGQYLMWYMATPNLVTSSQWQTGFASSEDGLNWTKDPNNPVLQVGNTGQWDEDWAVSYDIFKINEGTYNMLYIGSDLQEYHLGIATWDRAKDPIDNPVLDPGPPGAWDAGFVGTSSILFDGSTYRMWYSGRNSNLRSGYATSPDGVTWKKYDDPTTTDPLFIQSDPVLNPGQPGEWDAEQATAPFVLLLDTTYHMWYRGKDNTVGNGPASIGHATSKDGINWEKDTLNNPVLTPGTAGSWDAQWIGYQSVVFDGTIYHMWYEGWGGGVDQNQIGHATSVHPDSTWIKDSNNPVLSFGAIGSWDYPRVDFPNVIYDGNTYHMWYSGGGSFTWRIGYASSPDGSTWTKYAGNPVLGLGASGSWDDMYVGVCSVILDNDISGNKMWYCGGNGVWDGHIGYTTVFPDIINGLSDKISAGIPERFALSQNYPNPFNPSTTIKFTLARTQYTTLKVYNILGEKVETLVSDKLNQGNYSYQFDGRNLASGVYYYQLVTGNYMEVKKMVLLR